MIAFLIGGEGRFMDAMINKLNKDGHRVYLLTGTKNSHTSYQILLFLWVHMIPDMIGRIQEKHRYSLQQI